MADAKHAAADTSFRVSVLRNLGGAALLVALVAGMFWAIGMIGRADDGPLIAADAADEPEAADDPGTGTDEPNDDEDEAAAEDAAEDASTDAGASDDGEVGDAQDGDAAADDSASDPPEADGAQDGDDEEGSAADPAPESEPEPEPDPPAPSVDPAEVSVQVLDGYQSDGGTAAAAVADELAAAGYDIVARNPALSYEVTAVLWTAGNEEAARQVATAIGAAEVREQPGNLSTAVDVHVVVGADRG